MFVTLDKVSKAFGEKKVFTDVSLAFSKGEKVCFFGPSGCGKTTLLRIICGLEKADSGHVTLAKGMRYACHFQEDRLLPWYTVEENLALVMPREEVCGWLNRIGLPDACALYPDELSGGMRRRVSLARALGHESDVLVLDEPLRELDVPTAASMLELIRESIGDRLLLLVTHDRPQAEELGCRIIDFPL